MNIRTALLAAAALASAGAASAATVEIRDAVVRVTVIPEDRADVKVEVVTPNARLPLTVSTSGDRTVIDGDLYRAIRDCSGRAEDRRVKVRGVGTVEWSEMPQIVVRTPKSVAITSNGAVYGAIGRSSGLDLKNSGCSAWTIADVAGDVSLHESGAGSVRMGSANRLKVRLSGAGQVNAVHVREALDAAISGAGGLKVDRLDGQLGANVSGVGQISVADGHASNMRAQVSGVGGVRFGGMAETLDAQISGMGGIKVREVRGQVRKQVSGAGKVTVGEPI